MNTISVGQLSQKTNMGYGQRRRNREKFELEKKNLKWRRKVQGLVGFETKCKLI
jgi:hypothetical protein